ncbi:hypothetical protein P29A0810_074 [Synechococcus phage S-CAM8]|uniref:Uncharacterized protein n=1 Tax=Synechococcus phage S-CAM8 TaxID=754038 RepID=A0A1D8KMX5_9CAUD|nr:hypothetical protein P29A0810_074 [Synechococcus phage S-CAM8]
MKDFTQGQHVTYNQFQGKVNFICEHYVTLTIQEWDKLPQEQVNAKRNTHQVNLCVYRHHWKDIHLVSPQVNNTFSTDIAEIVENIK